MPPVAPSDPNKIRISIVDDDKSLRDALQALLNALGFSAEAHGSVAEFIQSGGIHRTHCLILDLLMPDIDGFTLQSCLRDTNCTFPVIVCSGHANDEFRRIALANGAVAYLVKPVKRDLLLHAIKSALPLRFPAGT
jgi:two-component system response regulator FixJ